MIDIDLLFQMNLRQLVEEWQDVKVAEKDARMEAKAGGGMTGPEPEKVAFMDKVESLKIDAETIEMVLRVKIAER